VPYLSSHPTAPAGPNFNSTRPLWHTPTTRGGRIAARHPAELLTVVYERHIAFPFPRNSCAATAVATRCAVRLTSLATQCTQLGWVKAGSLWSLLSKHNTARLLPMARGTPKTHICSKEHHGPSWRPIESYERAVAWLLPGSTAVDTRPPAPNLCTASDLTSALALRFRPLHLRPECPKGSSRGVLSLSGRSGYATANILRTSRAGLNPALACEIGR
jgi:hypothetical protein